MTDDRNPNACAFFNTGYLLEGKWVLIECIGKGGMGEVYRAHQVNLKRDVAVKLISGDLINEMAENPQELESAVARFGREVQAMAQVRHPNVLQIYDYGSTRVQRGGRNTPLEFIAMEYIPGNTLRFTMSEQGIEDEDEMIVDWLRRYFFPVLDGVEAIHAHGFVHRDLKPENVLMDGETPKIADFGLARSFRLKAVSNSWEVRGTWPYMAPEQFSDFRKAGLEADIYALGKILFEAIIGKMDPKMLPFKMVGLSSPQTPLTRSLDEIIRKATQEDKHQRYPSVTDLRQALQTALRAAAAPPPPGVRPSHPRWIWAGIAAAILSVSAMAVYHLVDSPSPGRLSVPTDAVTPDGRNNLAKTWMAVDGRQMILVASADEVAPFYADPRPVTFHHFVEFLNQYAARLEVKDGVVTYNSDIWLYLGGGEEPYEQIVFRHGRFHIRQTDWAPRPVRRVTWFGAAAYAQYYGKRLPTYEQYEALAARHEDAVRPAPARGVAADEEAPAPSMHMDMMTHDQRSSGNQTPEASRGRLTMEWLAGDAAQSAAKPVAAWSGTPQTPRRLQRQPWEAFRDTGFRTVLNLDAG